MNEYRNDEFPQNNEKTQPEQPAPPHGSETGHVPQSGYAENMPQGIGGGNIPQSGYAENIPQDTAPSYPPQGGIPGEDIPPGLTPRAPFVANTTPTTTHKVTNVILKIIAVCGIVILAIVACAITACFVMLL